MLSRPCSVEPRDDSPRCCGKVRASSRPASTHPTDTASHTFCSLTTKYRRQAPVMSEISPISPTHTADPASPTMGIVRSRKPADPGHGFSRAARAASPAGPVSTLQEPRLNRQPVRSEDAGALQQPPCPCCLLSLSWFPPRSARRPAWARAARPHVLPSRGRRVPTRRFQGCHGRQ